MTLRIASRLDLSIALEVNKLTLSSANKVLYCGRDATCPRRWRVIDRLGRSVGELVETTRKHDWTIHVRGKQ